MINGLSNLLSRLLITFYMTTNNMINITNQHQLEKYYTLTPSFTQSCISKLVQILCNHF